MIYPSIATCQVEYREKSPMSRKNGSELPGVRGYPLRNHHRGPTVTIDRTAQPRPPEEIVRLDDPKSGLRGVIVLHSTNLGPAAGGCRFKPYVSEHEASLDTLRLAEGMSYKIALAGLPLGGNKAENNKPTAEKDRGALFRAVGRAVA